VSLFTIVKVKCNYCGMCIDECPPRVIVQDGPQSPPRMIDTGEEDCLRCGHCVAVCPTGAVGIEGMAPEQCTKLDRKLLPTAEQVELLLKSRRSIRSYKDKPVPREKLEKLIDIARFAPSGHNSQPVQWLVVENAQETRRLGGMVVEWMRAIVESKPEMAANLRWDSIVEQYDAGYDYILRGAPHVIAAHADKANAMMAPAASVIALTYLELAAYAMGLGACWAGYFHFACGSYKPLQEALALPEGHQVHGAMMVGYPKHRFSRIPLRNAPKVAWR
jgi:nitroreductase/NAD-dependent dihydropyrimidine dehydrogenase PreA subunit